MHIAILGAGNVGAALGKGWALKGHAIAYGVPDPSDAKHRTVAEVGRQGANRHGRRGRARRRRGGARGAVRCRRQGARGGWGFVRAGS